MDWRRLRRIQAELLLLSRDGFQGSDFHASVPLGLQIANCLHEVAFPSTLRTLVTGFDLVCPLLPSSLFLCLVLRAPVSWALLGLREIASLSPDETGGWIGLPELN